MVPFCYRTVMLALVLAFTMTTKPLILRGSLLARTNAIQARVAKPCSITIGVGHNGALFFDRFNGWYKTTPKMLKSVLSAGCYNDNDPQPISSVSLALVAGAPKAKMDLIFSILAQQGWPKNRVHIQNWDDYPQRPPH
jgi:hypothetical protein